MASEACYAHPTLQVTEVRENSKVLKDLPRESDSKLGVRKMSYNVACISDVRRIYNGLYSQIRLIWAEGVQPPNQIYSS